jgi:hypothetical protein
MELDPKGTKVMEFFQAAIPFITLFMTVDLTMWAFWSLWSFVKHLFGTPISE